MKPELVSPAGNFVSLRAAIDAKADAVYFGIDEFNLRKNAGNFSPKSIKEIVRLCHINKVRSYLTLNSIIYDKEINRVRKILTEAKKAGIDAVIAWDFAIILLCNELNIPVHLSTQASISNFTALSFLKENIRNLKCIVLARELSLEKISYIIKKIKEHSMQIEIETFVHGAMCMSISGRCFLSHELFNKSANRGECMQPCRRKYLLTEKEDNYQLELGSDFILSTRDICTLPFIDKLIKSGISKFKIEGRNRSPEYVKAVTECYRFAIDSAIKNQLSRDLIDSLLKKLKEVYNRGFSSGFYLGMPSAMEHANEHGSIATTRKLYIGTVRNFYNKIGVAEVRIDTGSLNIGDIIMFQGETTGIVEIKISSMQINHKDIQTSTKGETVAIKIPCIVRRNDKVYLKLSNNKNATHSSIL